MSAVFRLPVNDAGAIPVFQVSPSGAPVVAADAAVGITGFGKLALTNASTLLSTMTLGPNSADWPSTPGVVDIQNDAASADVIYVCPLGGTCSAANGIPILVGGSFRFTIPATVMTVIAASTATVRVQF